MALGRYAIDYGIVKGVSPETVVKIQSPCGLLTANVRYEDGKSGVVRLRSSPCFVFATDLTIDLGMLAYTYLMIPNNTVTYWCGLSGAVENSKLHCLYDYTLNIFHLTFFIMIEHT